MSHNKLDTIIEKLNKVIELLAPKDIVTNSAISVTSSNEHSLDIVEVLSKLTQRLKKDDRV